jgi:hypothetical protein
MSQQGFTHLDLWYQTRTAPHIDNTSAANNPNTDLSAVPTAATISFTDGPRREVSPEQFEERCAKPNVVADFLIQRAMLDPDATVKPA